MKYSANPKIAYKLFPTKLVVYNSAAILIRNSQNSLDSRARKYNNDRKSFDFLSHRLQLQPTTLCNFNLPHTGVALFAWISVSLFLLYPHLLFLPFIFYLRTHLTLSYQLQTHENDSVIAYSRGQLDFLQHTKWQTKELYLTVHNIYIYIYILPSWWFNFPIHMQTIYLIYIFHI